MNIQELESKHTSGLYNKRKVTIVRGSGAHLWDDLGKEYIDCVGGQGAANIGHCNPSVVEAITKQASTLILCPEMFYNDQRALLEAKLCGLASMEKVFLCNSGTESVEAAIKFSRQMTGRQEIVAARRGFHGRTMGSLSATWEKKYRESFEPLVPGFSHIAYNDLDGLSQAVNQHTAAVILEVVQGEGGVRPGSHDFLVGAQALCREKGALLILDEVQTGFCRTGKMFAHQHHNLQPDILCVAKSMAGGLPMGATLVRAGLPELQSQTHGSTFGGNPLACAAALAAIQFMEDQSLAQKASELGDWFISQLNSIQSPFVREVRGMGLMVGLELKQKVTPFLQALMDDGIMALSAGLTVMRFLPPLVIDKSDLEQVVQAVNRVLNQTMLSGE